MKEIFTNFKKFDSFLKDQLLIGLFIQCVWALVVPLIYKLQGLLWSTTYISIYLILLRTSGLIVPYFKGLKLKKVYKSIIILNLIYALSATLYFYNQFYFLWAEVLLSVLFGINSQLLSIAWDVYVVDRYKKEVFENYKYCAAFRDSVGGIGGYSLVAIIYAFLNETQSMKLFIFMMVFALFAQTYNYKKHYTKMAD